MGILPYPKSHTLFITGSKVGKNGKERTIVVESRAEFAILTLQGTKAQLPLAWEAIYDLAVKQHAANLRLEKQAGKERRQSRAAKTRQAP